MRVYGKKRRIANPSLSSQKRAGRLAQKQGKSAEEVLLSSHDCDALIYKRYEPYRRLNGGTIFKAQSLEKSGCDYSIFTPHNAGMIEVKSREADRLALSALDEKQHEQLAQLGEWGRISLVLARLRGEWYCIPYLLFKTPPSGKKSWNRTDLAPFAVSYCPATACLSLQVHIDRHYPLPSPHKPAVPPVHR
jgi:hypothetical protein